MKIQLGIRKGHVNLILVFPFYIFLKPPVVVVEAWVEACPGEASSANALPMAR